MKSWRQSGLALVEFAIVVPFMLFMLFAIADVGRMMYLKNTLTKAVEEAARFHGDRGCSGFSGASQIFTGIVAGGGQWTTQPVPAITYQTTPSGQLTGTTCDASVRPYVRVFADANVAWMVPGAAKVLGGQGYTNGQNTMYMTAVAIQRIMQ